MSDTLIELPVGATFIFNLHTKVECCVGSPVKESVCDSCCFLVRDKNNQPSCRIMNSSIACTKSGRRDKQSVYFKEVPLVYSPVWVSPQDELPPIKKNILIYTEAGGVAEGEYLGSDEWLQYRWATAYKTPDVLQWCYLGSILNHG